LGQPTRDVEAAQIEASCLEKRCIVQLTIVGLGTVGASVGLALKGVLSEIIVVGHDPAAERVKRAQALGAIDKSHWNLISACEEADLVLLDLPLGELEKTLSALATAQIPSGSGDRAALILDNVMVKRPVMSLAERYAWRGAHFVGGHIVSPQLRATVDPSAELLKGARYYLVSSAVAPAEALAAAADFAHALGAEPRFIDAAEHDGIMAAVAQTPAWGALALLNVLRQEAGAQERSLADAPALAALHDLAWPGGTASLDELLTNTDNLLHWISVYGRELATWRALIERGAQTELKEHLEATLEACDAWLAAERASDAETMDDRPSGWRSLFLGDLGRLRRKR
jgi:prephenate dehydrogenase